MTKAHKMEFRSIEFDNGTFGIDFILDGLTSHKAAHVAGARIAKIMMENCKSIFGDSYISFNLQDYLSVNASDHLSANKDIDRRH